MLIYFGGNQDLSANGTATGQVPEMRRRFCAGVTWAPDQSSYNIYMYGGATTPGVLGGGYDDLYVLSIPTFGWIKMYLVGRNSTGDYPHHSLSCNMTPDRARMIISGGQFPLTGGPNNVDLGKQNPGKTLWELYKPNKTTYAVPDEVLAVVGGNGDGVYDAHGHMWVPQKTTPQPVEAEVQPAPAHEPQELSANPGDRAEASAQHQTYYNP
ncbi:hypothetical protein LZ30DRAFT_786055 [Colletotrichum cereale]|nr:hypothetical protein LZ30DRAFT_786055 [Colletotrichum cereale]